MQATADLRVVSVAKIVGSSVAVCLVCADSPLSVLSTANPLK